MESLDEYAELRETVREVGEERAEQTRELYRRIEDAFEEYRDDATGHGEFGKYVEFQNIVIAAEENLEEAEVYRSEDFERALSRLDARTLQDKHFQGARSDLTEVAEFVEKYDRYENLREELREELSELEKRTEELESRAEETEKRLEKAELAQEVDCSKLRETVEEYNEGVRGDFEGFVSEAPAVEVARLGEKTLDAPLVDDAPIERGAADRLGRYVDDETVSRVLELADASDGKLSHYFEDPDGFRDAVPRVFFETAEPEPFELSYETEGVVRRRVPELVSLVGRFAEEETVAALRRVGDIARNGEYAEARNALLAEKEAGASIEELQDELDEVRSEKERAEERAEDIRNALQK